MAKSHYLNLLHRIAFKQTELVKGCPANCNCSVQCLSLIAPTWDQRFKCWMEFYDKASETAFHTQDADILKCSMCMHQNTLKCHGCGWEKEQWEPAHE